VIEQAFQMLADNVRGLRVDEALFVPPGGHRSTLGTLKHIAGWTHVYRSYAFDDAALESPRPMHWGELKPLFDIVATIARHHVYHAGEINQLLSIARGEAWEEHQEVEENQVSTVGWLAERRYRIGPYGLNILRELAALARQRLPQWADRIAVGNAIDWTPERRFDFVRRAFWLETST
jgi:hypothetical protein